VIQAHNTQHILHKLSLSGRVLNVPTHIMPQGQPASVSSQVLTPARHSLHDAFAWLP